jgi:hypothetical protein
LAEAGLEAHRGAEGSFIHGHWETREKKYQKTELTCEGRKTTTTTEKKKDGIKTNDEMEVTRGVVGRVDGLDSSGCQAK